MIFFNKKLFYKNANEWIKKLLKISWDIPENKQIKRKFDIKSDILDII